MENDAGSNGFTLDGIGLAGLDTVTRSESGVAMTVLRADGSGDPVTMTNGQALTLTLLGSDSKRYRAAMRTNSERRATRIQQMQRAKRINGAEEFDIADRELLDLTLACTVGWNLIDGSGALVAVTESNVRAFYTRFPAAREQADMFIGSRANFLLDSGPNSSSSPASTSAAANP